MTRAEVARRLKLSRDQLAAWERDSIVRVARDDRGVPQYGDAEVERIAGLIASGELAASTNGRQRARVHQPRRSAMSVVRPETTPENAVDPPDVSPSIARAIAPATSSPITATITLTDCEPRPVAATIERDRPDVSATKPAASNAASTDADVRAIRIAAERERAEAERACAQIERIQAEALLAETTRLLRDQNRARRTNEVVEETLATVFDYERDDVEDAVRQRLIGVANLDDRWVVGLAVRDAIVAVRRQLVERRAAAERAAADQRRLAAERVAAARAADEARRAAEAHAQAAAKSLTATQHVQRVRELVGTVVVPDLHAFGLPPPAIARVAQHVGDQLAQVDAAVLCGHSWPTHVARTIIANAMGVSAPRPPVVWTPSSGWRVAQLGD